MFTMLSFLNVLRSYILLAEHYSIDLDPYVGFYADLGDFNISQSHVNDR